ncbi:type II toxin-antitoxin system death-on-curing family toxin [Candidatus Saccharibacteria bacterium]|nr:type II toxin-antitoxin system death-on-curing family toxin [Candidatus Saccharibacteria bacterium]
MNYITYPTYDDLLDKHNEVIRKSGGVMGVFNENLLRGFIEFIQDDVYYPSFEEKLTHLVFSIAKNHGFCDGNKRTAIIAGAFFLELNAFDQFIIDAFIQNMEGVILLTAQGLINKDQLRQMINDFIHNGEMSEETKMIYVELLGKISSEGYLAE